MSYSCVRNDSIRVSYEYLYTKVIGSENEFAVAFNEVVDDLENVRSFEMLGSVSAYYEVIAGRGWISDYIMNL